MTATQTTLDEALDLEIASAGAPPDVDLCARLHDAYAAMGLERESLGVIQAMTPLGGTGHAQTVRYLSLLIERGLLKELSTAVAQTIQRVPNPPAEVLRVLARAYSVLGQADSAARQWETLLDRGLAAEEDWESLARFVARHGARPQLQAAIDGHAVEGSNGPAAAYCAYGRVCAWLEDDPAEARRILTAAVDPDRIEDPVISLDLAMAAFRLNDLGRAQRAAENALAQGADPEIAKSILDTVRSFDGESKHLARRLSPPVGTPELVVQRVRKVKRKEFAWGYVAQKPGKLVVEFVPFRPIDERCMELPESEHVIASFSVLPALKLADPFEVLPFVDWAWPHLLVRRYPKTRVHAFLAGRAGREWAWCEAQLGRGEVAAAKPRTKESGLLVRAFAELNRMEDE